VSTCTTRNIWLQEMVGRAYGHRCPYCDVLMIKPSHPPERNNKSRSHIYSTNHTRGSRRMDWIHACLQCNYDQGHLSLEEWCLILDFREDHRLFRARAVLEMFREYKNDTD
jgi:hypothetical protein